MKKTALLLIVIMLLVINCSTSSRHYKKDSFIHKYESLALPAWIYDSQGQDFVVGISRKSYNLEDMEDAAKQMAAVMKCRNEGSYTIEKYATTESEKLMGSGKVVFKLNVCADPEDMKRIYENLELIDQTEICGFFLGLYTIGGKNIENNYRKKSVQKFPDWFSEEKLIANDDVIYAYQTESSSDLETAWIRAAENARQELAKYLEKDVMGRITSIDDEFEKDIIIESTKKLVNMEITRSYIQSELKDALYSFKVYLELKMVR